ncbi:MAG: hypothetical protein IJO20_03430 [Ruminococcus sp.]|nr:hypothetical protein [Ruminococcus sp.]
MKKRNIICFIILVLSTIAFVAYDQYREKTDDVTAPVITADSDTITGSVKITDEELLSGMKAYDEISGDVSDTLIIEKKSDFINENERLISYVAIDESMNVGRYERTLIYDDYSEPKFVLSKPLSYVVGTRIDILENISAESSLDGDISQQIRYGLDSVIDNMKVGKYPVEFRVTDSCGNTSYLNTEIEIYDSSYSGIKVELHKYLTYIPKGARFNKLAYYKSSNIEGNVYAVSTVNTKVAGTYYVDYYVNGVNAKGKSRLIVVVY